MKRLLFVYGTLKRGHHNHYLLRNSKFLGEFKTPPEYSMYSMGGFPAVTRDGSTEITGEVYEINDKNVSDTVNSLEGYTGVRDHESNWYDTIDIETPFGRAEMFYFKRNINRQLIKSGIWENI